MEREEALDKYKWDLKDIYPTQQEWDKDYEELMANVSRYEDYKGKLNTEETLKDYMSFNEWFKLYFILESKPIGRQGLPAKQFVR